MASVCEIRDRAATILRQCGYFAAVQIPEQRIEDGVVRFRVLLAHMSKIQVRGDASGAESVIAGYLNKLTEDEAFNRFASERYLLLASDIPGYLVRLTLRPAGTAPGDVIGDVTVQRTPAYADINIQDYGSRELGLWGGLLRGQLYGLTGLGDRTTLAFFSTSDFEVQQTIQLAHDFRLGSEGLTLGGSITYAWARPGVDEDVEIKANTLFVTIMAEYPLIRSLSHTLRGSIGMDISNEDVELDRIDLTEDRLRVAFARLSFDAIDPEFDNPAFTPAEPPWRVTAIFEARQGLHILGATPDCGPTGTPCLGVGEVIRTKLSNEYRRVRVDVGRLDKNQDLAARYGVTLSAGALPHLTVLDKSGNVVTQQPARELAAAPGGATVYEPEKIAAFLTQNQVAPVPADPLLAAALAEAKRDGKYVFLWFSAPW